MAKPNWKLHKTCGLYLKWQNPTRIFHSTYQMNLPARLNHAGQIPAQCFLTEANTTQTKPTHVATRATAFAATIADLNWIFAARFAYND